MEGTGSSGCAGGCWRGSRSTCWFGVSLKFFKAASSNAATQLHRDTNSDKTVLPPTNGWFPAGRNRKLFVFLVWKIQTFFMLSPRFILKHKIPACCLQQGLGFLNGMNADRKWRDFPPACIILILCSVSFACKWAEYGEMHLKTTTTTAKSHASKSTNAILLSSDSCQWIWKSRDGLFPAYIHSTVHMEVLLPFGIQLVKTECFKGWEKPVVRQPRLWR